jgi:hypothetical protein
MCGAHTSRLWVQQVVRYTPPLSNPGMFARQEYFSCLRCERQLILIDQRRMINMIDQRVLDRPPMTFGKYCATITGASANGHQPSHELHEADSMQLHGSILLVPHEPLNRCVVKHADGAAPTRDDLIFDSASFDDSRNDEVVFRWHSYIRPKSSYYGYYSLTFLLDFKTKSI